jgi:transcriptional regulator with XRE-family HTH domain
MMAQKSPSPTDRYVGTRIRMRRLMLDMSQTRLADALGITFQQIQKYEKGANRVGASRLQIIAHVLQVPVSFFFEGAPAVPGQKLTGAAAPSPAYVSDFVSSSEGLALMHAFTRINDTKIRRRIIGLVDRIASGGDL